MVLKNLLNRLPLLLGDWVLGGQLLGGQLSVRRFFFSFKGFVLGFLL